MKFLDYADIQDEYNAWKAKYPEKTLGLAEFARQKDAIEGGQPLRQQAYDPGFLKDLNAHVDRFFRPVSEVTAQGGKAIDEALGAVGLDSKGAAEMGLRELPRAFVEFMPFSGPAGKVNLLRRAAQGLGMASAGVNTYSDTDSPLAGVIGAAGLPLTAKAADLGEHLVAKYLARGTAPEMIERVGAEGIKRTNAKDALGVFTGGNVGAGLVGEAQRMATIGAVKGEDTTLEDLNPFTVENAVSQAVGLLPEAAMRTGPELISGRGSQRVQDYRGEKISEHVLKEVDPTGKSWDEIVKLSGGTGPQARLVRKMLVRDILDQRAKAIADGQDPDTMSGVVLSRAMRGVTGLEFEGPEQETQYKALARFVDQTGLPYFYQEGVAKGGRSIRQTVGKTRIDKFFEDKKIFTVQGENVGLVTRQGVPQGQPMGVFEGLEKGVSLVFDDKDVKLGTDGRTLQQMPVRPKAVLIDTETAGGRITEVEKGKQTFTTDLTPEAMGYTPEERKQHIQNLLNEAIAAQKAFVAAKAQYEAQQAQYGQQAKPTTSQVREYNPHTGQILRDTVTDVVPFSETKEGKEMLKKVSAAYDRMSKVPHLMSYRNYGLPDVIPGFTANDAITLKLLRLGVPEDLPVYVYEKDQNGRIRYMEKVAYDQLSEAHAMQLANTPTEKIGEIASLGAFVRDVNSVIKELWDQGRVVERTKKEELARARRLRMMVLGPDTRFLEESPEAVNRQELDAINPAALRMYQDQGYIPRVDQDLMAKLFGEQWEKSITYTDQEAYYGMVQTIKNYLYQAVDDAKARKAKDVKTDYESSQRAKTFEELDQEYFDLLQLIPEDLQREVIDFRLKLENLYRVKGKKEKISEEELAGIDRSQWDAVSDTTLYGEEFEAVRRGEAPKEVDPVEEENMQLARLAGKNVNEEALSPEDLKLYNALKNIDGREMSYVPSHKEIVIQAIRNYDPATGMTSFKQTTYKPGEGFKKDANDPNKLIPIKVWKAKEEVVTLPLREALLAKPKARPIFADRITRESTSLDAMSENRSSAEKDTTFLDQEEIDNLLSDSASPAEAAEVADGFDPKALKPETPKLPAEETTDPSGLAARQSNSETEPDSIKAKTAKDVVVWYLNKLKTPEGFNSLWQTAYDNPEYDLRSVFSINRAYDPEFKKLVPLAIDAMLAGRQGTHGKGKKLTTDGEKILLQFGHAYRKYLKENSKKAANIEEVSLTAAAGWLKTFWSIGKDHNGAWKRFLGVVKKHVEKQLPPEARGMRSPEYIKTLREEGVLPLTKLDGTEYLHQLPTEADGTPTQKEGLFASSNLSGNRTVSTAPTQVSAETFIKNEVVKGLRKAGYTPELVQAFSNAALKATSIIKNKDVSFESLYGIDEINQTRVAPSRWLGLASPAPDAMKQNTTVGIAPIWEKVWDRSAPNYVTPEFLETVRGLRFVGTIMHEVMHTVGFLSFEGALKKRKLSYDEEIRVSAYKQAYDFIKNIGTAERLSLIQNLMDLVFPTEDRFIAAGGNQLDATYLKNIRNNYASYGATNPHETIAVFADLFLTGASFENSKKIDSGNLLEALRWQPDAIQDFIRNVFRDVSSIGTALVALANNPMYRNKAGLPPLLGDLQLVSQGTQKLLTLVSTVVRPDITTLKAKKTLQETLAYLNPGSIEAMAQGPISSYTGIVPPSRPSAPIAIAQNFLFGKPVVGQDKMNYWNRWFMPFHIAALRTGNPLATELALVLLDVGASRISNGHLMYSPIMRRDSDNFLRTDPNSALYRLARMKDDAGAPRVKNAFNEASRYLQYLLERGSLDTIQLKRGPDLRIRDSMTQLLAQSPDMQKFAQGLFAKMSPTERGLVVSAMNEALEVYQNAGQVMVASQTNHVTSRVAHLFLMSGFKNTKESVVRADALVRSLLSPPGNQQTALQNQAFAGMSPEAKARITDVAVDLTNSVLKLQEHIDSRPFFMSEQRPGKFLVVSEQMGERQTHGADSHAHAQEVVKELQKRGNSNFRIIDKAVEFRQYAGMLPERYAETFIQIEKIGFDKAMEKVKKHFPGITPDALRVFKEEFNPGSSVLNETTKTGIQKYLKERSLLGGREDLDYIRTLEGYVGGMMSAAANRRARDLVGLYLKDESFQGMPDFVAMAESQLEHTLRPASDTVAKLKNISSAYFLGMNLSSMLVEGTQNLITVVPFLIRDGDNIRTAYGRLGSAIKELVTMPKGSAMLAAQKRGVLANASKADEKAYWYRKFIDEHPDGTNAYDDMNIHDDLSSIFTARNRHGNLEDVAPQKLALNGLYHGARFMMKFYGKVSNWNNKVAFLAAFTKAQEQGLKGVAAYDFAQNMVFASTFGGGRANNPGWVGQMSKGTPAVALAHTLQQYSVGMASLMGTFAKDAIMGNKNLTHIQRKQMIKAAGVIWGTQFALAGAIGLPGVALALKTIDTLFGTNSEADIREYLAEKFGQEDEELGHLISDAAMNGVGTQVFEKAGIGIDISGRTGLSNLLGTNGYEGFSFTGFLGPTPQIMKNLLNGGSKMFQGDFAGGAREAAPQAFKNLIEMYDTRRKYGKLQMMDQYNNMIGDMTNMEALTYAIGFRGGENRRYRTAKRLQVQENALADGQRDKELNAAAQALLKEDPSVLGKYITQGLRNGTISDPRSTLDSILDRAIDMSTPKDLLAMRGADRGILRAVAGQALNRQSEIQRLDIKEAALQKLGYPFGMRPAGPRERLRALVIDELTSKGLTRQEAVEEFNRRFGRQAIYPSPTGEMWDVEEDL